MKIDLPEIANPIQRSSISTLLIFVVCFLTYLLLSQYFLLKSFNVLEIKGHFPPKTSAYYNSSTPLHGFNEQTSLTTQNPHDEPISVLRLQLSNRIVDRFKLTFHHTDEKFHIQSMALFSHFSKHSVVWDENNLFDSFSTDKKALPNDNTGLDEAKLGSTYELKESIAAKNFFLAWVLPFVLAISTTLLIRTTQWSMIPAINDLLSNQQGRNKKNYPSLDGLRGIAAIFVLLEHTTIHFNGVGHLGVWLFFVLSGFLLMKPFVMTPKEMLRPSKLALFLERRIKRIIPMYFFMITCVYLFTQRIEDAVRHYLLAQGDGHYWSILQEVYFYMALPLIATIVYSISKGRPWLSCGALVVMAVIWSYFQSGDNTSVYAMGVALPLFFEVFIIGAIGTYLFHAIFMQAPTAIAFFERHCSIITILGGLFFIGLIQAFMSQNLFGTFIEAFTHPILSAILCLSLILLAVMLPSHSWYNRILSFSLFRYVGIIGFSFYLFHPYAVTLVIYSIEHFLQVPVDYIGSTPLVLATFVVTVITASFTYSYIERPFLTKQHSKQ